MTIISSLIIYWEALIVLWYPMLNFPYYTQKRQTRNGSLNIWNRAGENDRLDSRAIILINALRKWGVLFTDELICEMDENCFRNYYHQIADLYIFGNGDLIDL